MCSPPRGCIGDVGVGAGYYGMRGWSRLEGRGTSSFLRAMGGVGVICPPTFAFLFSRYRGTGVASVVSLIRSTMPYLT